MISNISQEKTKMLFLDDMNVNRGKAITVRNRMEQRIYFTSIFFINQRYNSFFQKITNIKTVSPVKPPFPTSKSMREKEKTVISG